MTSKNLRTSNRKFRPFRQNCRFFPFAMPLFFPTQSYLLTVGRESSVKMINDVQQSDGMLVVLTQRDKRVDCAGPGGPL